MKIKGRARAVRRAATGITHLNDMSGVCDRYKITAPELGVQPRKVPPAPVVPWKHRLTVLWRGRAVR